MGFLEINMCRNKVVSTFLAAEAVQVNAVSPHNWPENLVSPQTQSKGYFHLSWCKGFPGFTYTNVLVSCADAVPPSASTSSP